MRKQPSSSKNVFNSLFSLWLVPSRSIISLICPLPLLEIQRGEHAWRQEELSLLYCKIQEKIFLETNTVPTYIAQGLFPIFTSKSCLCRGRNASSHSHLFEINTVNFTDAVITLGRDASNPRIYDLSSTWGEASECISFNTWPFATVIQFKTVGVSLRSD